MSYSYLIIFIHCRWWSLAVGSCKGWETSNCRRWSVRGSTRSGRRCFWWGGAVVVPRTRGIGQQCSMAGVFGRRGCSARVGESVGGGEEGDWDGVARVKGLGCECRYNSMSTCILRRCMRVRLASGGAGRPSPRCTWRRSPAQAELQLDSNVDSENSAMQAKVFDKIFLGFFIVTLPKD